MTDTPFDYDAFLKDHEDEDGCIDASAQVLAAVHELDAIALQLPKELRLRLEQVSNDLFCLSDCVGF